MDIKNTDISILKHVSHLVNRKNWRDNVLKVFIVLMIIEGLIFTYLFILNIKADVICRSFVPTMASGIVGVCITFWTSKKYEDRQTLTEQFEKKIIPSLFIGLTLSLFTLWFSLTKEKIEITIPAYIVTDYNTGESLEKCDAKYERFFGSKSYQIRRYVKYTPYVISSKYGFGKHVYPHDVIFLETLTLLFSACQQDEDLGMIIPSINPGYDVSGIGGIYLVNPITSSPFTRIPKQSLRRIKLSEELKKQFSEDVQEIYTQLEDIDVLNLFGLNDMYLSKETEIEIKCDNVNRTINFKNKFCDVEIKICDFGNYAGLSNDWQSILGYENKEDRRYLTSKTAIIFKAEFSKRRSGHPDMSQYQEWIKAIIERLNICLNSELRLKTAKEKYFLHKTEIDTFSKTANMEKNIKETASNKAEFKPDPNDPLIGSSRFVVINGDKTDISYRKIIIPMLIILLLFLTSGYIYLHTNKK